MTNGSTGLRAQLGNRPKVAIVGFCSTSRDATPWDDPSFEVWGLNRGYLFHRSTAARVVPGTPADRWHEMHGSNIYTSQQRRPGRHVEFLNNFPGPVYMHTKFDEVPKAVVYPLKEISDDLFQNILRIGHSENLKADIVSTSGGPGQLVISGPEDLKSLTLEPYLSSSISYEIALAIYEGFEEIHLYGVDLNTEAEYAWQKPGVEHLLGIAAARGVKVVLPDNCPLLKGTLYGRSFMSAEMEQFSYQQLETRMKSLTKETEQTQLAASRLEGALLELTEFVQQQMPPGIDQMAVEQQIKVLGLQQQRFLARLDQLEGQKYETERAFAKMQGVHAIVVETLQHMRPGIEHESLEDRRKEIEQRLQEEVRKGQILTGRIQEEAYWLHQTMEGQSPAEAIAQLKKLDQLELIAEGPIDEFEALVYRAPKVSNGHVNEDLMDELVGVGPV